MEDKKGKSATRAKNKYRDKTYDRMEIVLPKGKKEVFSIHAKERGESLNSFASRALDEAMQRDRKGGGG